MTAEMRNRLLYEAFLWLPAVGLFIWLIRAGRHGRRRSATLAVLCTSFLALGVLSVVMERRPPGMIYDLRHQSLAFMADGWGLTLVSWFAVPGWLVLKHKDGWRNWRGPWYNTVWWLATCIVLGIGAAVAFDQALDTPSYLAGGASAQLTAPSRLWHVRVSYPVLFAGLLYLYVPVAIHTNWRKWSIRLATLGVVIWLFGGIADATVHHLDARWLHRGYSYAHWHPLPETYPWYHGGRPVAIRLPA